MQRFAAAALSLALLALGYACASNLPRDVQSNPAALAQQAPERSFEGGFYHDGRFEDLNHVIAHDTQVLKLSLTDAEKADLVQFLKSL